jgi:hypothetical protein
MSRSNQAAFVRSLMTALTSFATKFIGCSEFARELEQRFSEAPGRFSPGRPDAVDLCEHRRQSSAAALPF